MLMFIYKDLALLLAWTMGREKQMSIRVKFFGFCQVCM